MHCFPPAPPSSPGPEEFSSLRASLFRSPTPSIPRPPLLVLQWGKIISEGVFSFSTLSNFFAGLMFGLLFSLITVHTTDMILLTFHLFTPVLQLKSSTLFLKTEESTYFRKDFGKLRHRYLYRYWIVTLHARKFEHDFGQHR